jgi:hypothetical protein
VSGWEARRGEEPDPLAGLREAAHKREARIKAAADPECSLCRGRGFTYGYIAPSKTASYPCRCTGIPEVE